MKRKIIINLDTIKLTENNINVIKNIRDQFDLDLVFIHTQNDIDDQMILNLFESSICELVNNVDNYIKSQSDKIIFLSNSAIDDLDLWNDMVINYGDDITKSSIERISNIHSRLNKPRHFVFSDVHGCLNELKQLITMIEYQPSDKIICLGDLVDRGPNVKGVIQFCIDLIGNKLFILGNHEEMFLEFINNPAYYYESYTYPGNGGEETLHSYLNEKHVVDIPEDHIIFLETMSQTFITDDDYIFVHAGLNPWLSLSQQRQDECRWIRDRFLNSKYSWGKMVIHGHTVTDSELIEKHKNRIAIDCGCVFGGKLACLELTQMKEYYVPSLKCSDIT